MDQITFTEKYNFKDTNHVFCFFPAMKIKSIINVITVLKSSQEKISPVSQTFAKNEYSVLLFFIYTLTEYLKQSIDNRKLCVRICL